MLAIPPALAPFMPLFFVLLAAFAGSALLTELVRKRLLAKAILDKPNERSLHKVPVPRGGGLAVTGIILIGLLASLFFPEADPVSVLFLLAALGLLLSVSWIDDKRGLSAGLRLAVHLLAALLGSFALHRSALLFGGLLPLWADRALIVLGWAWYMNLTNFMDGIDGITGVQTICVAAGVAFLLTQFNIFLCDFFCGSAEFGDLLLAALLIGSCAGFLLHNWHPAKIFLGDVGSVPLGFLTGFLLLRLATSAAPVAALILPLYYLIDSGLTITWRAVRGEKIWQPHREHFYQRAAAGEGRHDRVALWILLADIGLIGLAGWSLTTPLPALGCAFLVVLLLLAKMLKSAQKRCP